MLEWLRTFWYGRILFLARGEHLARFVNLVSRDGIILYHTQKSDRGMRAQIKLADFRRLRKAARQTHTRVHIVAKYGWPFVAARWWRRKGLLLGILIIASVLTILSQLVLSISLLGNKNLTSSEVLERAEELGLKRWVYAKDLDLNGIAKALQEQMPDAAWIGIERHGTNIQIRVSEKIRPSIPNEVGNLVASRAGIVKEIMVIDGQPLVHEGETVRAGQVLIQSPAGNNMSSSKGTPVAVARGFVRGRVWYSAEAQIPLVEDRVEESGKVAIGRGIKFGSRVIMLTTQNSPFEQSRQEEISQSLKLWRNWRFPVEGIRVNHIELRNVHIERSVDEARQLAEQAARTEVQKKITPGVSIVEETVKVLSNNSGSERVRVEVETYEDLAVYANP